MRAECKVDQVEVAPDGTVFIKYMKRIHNTETGEIIEGWHRTSVAPGVAPATQLRAVNDHLTAMGLPVPDTAALAVLGEARRDGRNGRVFARDRDADNIADAARVVQDAKVNPEAWEDAIAKAFPQEAERRRAANGKAVALDNWSDEAIAELAGPKPVKRR